MCNHEEDFRGIAKYKHKYELFDKIVMGLVLTTMIICLALIVYGAINPVYLMC